MAFSGDGAKLYVVGRVRYKENPAIPQNNTYATFPFVASGNGFAKTMASNMDGASHGFLATFDSKNKLTYCSRVGGDGHDGVTGITVLANNIAVILTGYTNGQWDNNAGKGYNTWVSKLTALNQPQNYPLVGNPTQTYTKNNSGGFDAFAIAYSSNMSIMWSSQIGGAGNEITDGNPETPQDGGDLMSCATNPATSRIRGDMRNGIVGDGSLYGKNFWITGGTQSKTATKLTSGLAATGTDFPLRDAAQTTFGGGNWDAFAMRFNLNVNNLLLASPTLTWSTYLGGNRDDFGTGIGTAPVANHTEANVYVVGRVEAPVTSKLGNFPTLNGINTYFSSTLNPNSTVSYNTEGFMAVYQRNNGLLNHATYVGGSENDFMRSISVTRQLLPADLLNKTSITQIEERVIAVGYANSCNYPFSRFAPTTSGLDDYFSNSIYLQQKPVDAYEGNKFGFITEFGVMTLKRPGEPADIDGNTPEEGVEIPAEPETSLGYVYPNPTSGDFLYVHQSESPVQSISIVDLMGTVRSEIPVSDPTAVSVNISTATLTQGVYILRVVTTTEVINLTFTFQP
jgi:hypothetical protein